MRGARALGLYAAIATCLLASCGQSDLEQSVNSVNDIVELKWLPGGVDKVAALTSLPAGCVPTDAEPTLRDLIRKGEIAFNDPFLLGGQAAKAGLSCGACHRNGRGNPDFIFQGISGAPGTADVTNGLFGPDRADDIFNPVPIPDLALPSGQVKVDRNKPDEIKAFLIAQITEEFSGREPFPPVLDGLVAYLQANDETACPPEAYELLTWRRDWQAALDAIRFAAEGNEDARFLRQAARVSLGRLHARYAAPEHADIRADLERLSRQLSQSVDQELPVFDFVALETQLATRVAASYYDPATLAIQLAENDR